MTDPGSIAEVEERMSKATGLSVRELRYLRDRFKEEGRTGEEFQRFAKWRAAQRGNVLTFEDRDTSGSGSCPDLDGTSKLK